MSYTDNKLATIVAYSCEELASMRLPGFPISRQGWDVLVKRLKWGFHEERSKGRGGIKRVYMPPPDVLALIESRLHGAVTTMSNHAVREPSSACYNDGGIALIERYVSMHSGADMTDQAVVKVCVDARLLRERVGSNFNRIKVASVSGDSMEPTLSHGDQVLVDTSCNRFVDDAIYAIQQDGFLCFKRIKLKLDGSIVVKSDAVPDDVESYSAQEASQFFVVGVVIPFKFGRFKTWSVATNVQNNSIPV